MKIANALGLPAGVALDLDRWFLEEVLPLEGVLVALVRRNWRNADEVADICQEVYLRVYESAAIERPDSTRSYVLSVARNLLIDKARRAQVVSIESVADLDSIDLSSNDLTPERYASGRGEMRLFQTALHELPPRCRQIIVMRKISGISQRDIAAELGITEHTVEKQISLGLRKLANALFAHDIHFDVPIFRTQANKKRDAT